MIAFWIGLGLILGSFTNVLIHRLPRGRSVVWPASHCPRCRAAIAWYDNLPLLSYAILRGRCRACGKAISCRYPAVEAAVGAIVGALWLKWGGNPAWMAAAACAAFAHVAVAVIDWDTFLIPDQLSLGLLAAGLLSSPINPLFAGAPWIRLAYSSAGAAFGFSLCWSVAALGEKVFKREAMGMGDVKLLAAVGAWSGILGAFDCLVVASFVGALYGGALLLRGKIARHEPIPFGPFLSAAAVFNFFYLLPFGFPLAR